MNCEENKIIKSKLQTTIANKTKILPTFYKDFKH